MIHLNFILIQNSDKKFRYDSLCKKYLSKKDVRLFEEEKKINL